MKNVVLHAQIKSDGVAVLHAQIKFERSLALHRPGGHAGDDLAGGEEGKEQGRDDDQGAHGHINSTERAEA